MIYPEKKSSLLAAALFIANGSFANDNIEEVLVTADFRDSSVQTTPASLTVLSALQLQQRAAQQLEDILNLAPNINSASGASRGRFIQIRGVGERSQFKEPLDSSVGLVVDGIDFSNIGLAGSLFDAKQVEVLRGPQGTSFGSSAMAGLINIQSAEPTQHFEGQANVGVGNYNARDSGLVLSGPLTDQLLGRLSVHKNTSDGYIKNDFLGRDDTNNFDEQIVRTKLRWLASEDLTLDFTAIYLNTDNGYDAFSLENTRHTRSDQPGYDRQESTAVAVMATWEGADAYTLEAQLTGEHTNLDYGFDWDWSDWNTVGVRGFENNSRDRQAASMDLRFLSKDGSEILGGASWVGGLYIYDREVELGYWEDADYYGAWTGQLESSFDTARYAAYGQLDWPLSDRMNLTVGARFERFDNDYEDSYGVTGESADNLWGGKLTLEYMLDDNSMLYASVGRGYKTAGINTDAFGKALISGDPATIAQLGSHLYYDSETVINYELGLKGSYLDDALTVNVAAFYMDRRDMQAKVALEITTANWTSYRDNVDNSNNYGIELETKWRLSDQLSLFGSAGWLETELGDLNIFDVNTGLPVDQSGREQAHAPGYQFNAGATYSFMDYYSLTVQVDGKDEFFFSNSHDQKADSYELVHANISYKRDNVSISVWGRNLTDEDYQVRGFYWANNPNNGWLVESYTQLGAPKTYGVTAQYDF